MQIAYTGGDAYGKSIMERLREFFVHDCEPPRSGVPAELQYEGGNSQSATARSLCTQEIDCMKLLASCPELGQPLYGSTLDLLGTLRAESAALCREAAQTVRPDDISIRLTHLPTLSAILPSLPPRRGQLVQVCGSIVRMSTKRVVPYAYRLMCPRCHAVVEDFTHPFDRAAQHKRKCERSECKKEELQVVGQVWMDYAECRLQQRSNQSGRLPRSILVTLDDELSTKCGVGQFIEVIGILHPTWRHLYPLSRPAIEPAVWAINVLPMEAYRGAALMAGVGGSAAAAANQQRRKNGRQSDRPKFSPEAFFTSFMKNKRRRGVALANSTAPQLAGLFAPRMSILLSALNGASMAGKTSMHIRSTIHCLFVGDPSTGKSQLLRFAASVAPRSTSTTGMGSTSAGLTVAATKEQGEWVLEPGALVLSDGGVCVIDELRTVSPADRASLHEAMEQQTISVAKGGLVTKLRTACCVLSACNPPPLKRNGRPEIGVGGPLLSRFDFIYLLWDTPQEDIDTRVADHVLSCNVANRHPDPPLMAEELARYLWWLRAQYAHVDGPLLSDAAADLLGRYYEIQRQRGMSPSLDDAVPVTIRLLESLVRITQAHAKLHLQSLCTVDDAAMAIFLMERSAHSLKVPLRVFGPDVYSSTRELDEVFLSDTPECIAMQDAVLEAIVNVIERFSLPITAAAMPPPAPSPFGESQHVASCGGDSFVGPADLSGALMGDDGPMNLSAFEGANDASPGFRGPSENGPASTRGAATMSRYERCQLAVSAAAALQGTQLTGDEASQSNSNLLAFRRCQLQQQLNTRAGPLSFMSAAPGPAAADGSSPVRGPRKSQEQLAQESVAALRQEVNATFSVASSRATYDRAAFDGRGPPRDADPAAVLRASRASERAEIGSQRSPATADCGGEYNLFPSQSSPLSSQNSVAVRFSNTAGSQFDSGCPPSIQQTAPFWSGTLPENHGCSLDSALFLPTPAAPAVAADSSASLSLLPSQHQSTQLPTQSGKKRKRTAEEIMQSLRLQL